AGFSPRTPSGPLSVAASDVAAAAAAEYSRGAFGKRGFEKHPKAFYGRSAVAPAGTWDGVSDEDAVGRSCGSGIPCGCGCSRGGFTRCVPKAWPGETSESFSWTIRGSTRGHMRRRFRRGCRRSIVRKPHPVWLRLQPRRIHAVRSGDSVLGNIRMLFMDDLREHPRPQGTAFPTRMLSVDHAEVASRVAAAAAAEDSRGAFGGLSSGKLPKAFHGRSAVAPAATRDGLSDEDPVGRSCGSRI
ncbi:MAG: hypothetical protein RLZZ188_794, partial [Verrucomicrobiota bacterium]